MSAIINSLNQLFNKLPKAEKALHGLVIIWVAVQIISSSFMHIRHSQDWTQANWLSQVHAYGGMLLGIISILFIVKVLSRRGFADLYPWLFRDISVIKADLQSLLKFTLPEAQPRGLAATIEGLGLLALLIALITGSAWFISVQSGADFPALLGLHKSSVGLIETYFYGHGLFGILHLIQIVYRAKTPSHE